MTEREALKLALKALEIGLTLIEDFGSTEQLNAQHKAITAIYEALAQPEQEPVGWYDSISGGMDFTFYKPHRKPSSPSAEWIPVYSRPPQRTWVGLTDKDWNRSKHNYDFQKGADWAESILKEKNT